MGLKLTVLSWWTPSWIISKELDHVSQVTTNALISLLATYAPNNQIRTLNEKTKQSKTISTKRASMAAGHAELVQKLVDSVGQNEAIKLGRDSLFEVGKNLGMETRDKLGVGDDPKNLIKAARILYRVLGIDFRVDWSNETQAILIVDHCALAQHYSELTCQVLSATDEGVVRGIAPNASMTFKELITSGCPKCKANIEFTMEKLTK